MKTMPAEKKKKSGGEAAKERSEEDVADAVVEARRPVFVGEVEGVDEDAGGPVGRDEGGDEQGGAVAAKKFVMERERPDAERNDREHGEASLYPKQFSIEGLQLSEVARPFQANRNLETGEENYKMADTGDPKRQIKQTVCE